MTTENGNGLFVKIMTGIIVALMLAGIGMAMGIQIQVNRLANTQEQILEIQKQIATTNNLLKENLIISMERQITKDNIKEQLKK